MTASGGLAVNDGKARRIGSPGLLAHRAVKRIVDVVERAIILPAFEVEVRRALDAQSIESQAILMIQEVFGAALRTL